MGSHCNIREGQKTLDRGSRENAAGHIFIYISGFFFVNIQTNGKEFMVTDTCDQVVSFDQSTSGSIYKDHAIFHFCNSFRIDQMLSSDYETKVRINKKELLSCIDRATLLVKEGDKKPIIINIGDELMELKIKSQIGSMNEEIMITKEGKDLLIGFNPKFLIDALRVIDDEEVTIYLMNAKAPCFIKDDAESYVYLILPVNFNSAA